ncbi:MAG TPA: DUF2269 family protein [Gaiellaceae bacterium]|nr:DUF2269 family protein [Gaiellaceae bacterium]
MSYYEALLYLHILAATLWIGGGFLILLLVHRGLQTDDDVLLERLARNSAWLAQRLFIPSSLAVLVLGILLTIDGPWGFGDLWIVLGLAGYALSFLTGVLFLEPEGKRIAAAIAEHGPKSAPARRHIARINAVQRMEMVILLLVVGAMALKPTSEDVLTLAVGAVIVVSTLAVGGRALARSADPSPAAVATD